MRKFILFAIVIVCVSTSAMAGSKQGNAKRCMESTTRNQIKVEDYIADLQAGNPATRPMMEKSNDCVKFDALHECEKILEKAEKAAMQKKGQSLQAPKFHYDGSEI